MDTKKDTENKKTKRKRVLKPRYRFFLSLANVLTAPYIKFKYHAIIEKFKPEKNQNYLILCNHQTPFDQFFINRAIKGDLFFVASEDILSNGAISKFLDYALGLIPIKKQTTDPRAAINCLRVARAGGSIVVFPEGNRTFSGETCYVKPSVASLVKTLKLPVIFFKIEGGYGAQPRWSRNYRKGRVVCRAESVMRPEEYSGLTDEELYSIIKERLYRNETETTERYYGKKLAENLESILYVCPECGFTTFTTEKNKIVCDRCRRSAEYTPDLTFKGDFPFKNVLEWYRYQESYVAAQPIFAETEEKFFSDSAKIMLVKPYERKKRLIDTATVSLFNDKITVEGAGEKLVFPFDETNLVTVLGRNKLNVYHGDKIFQIKGNRSFNALKYVNFFNLYRQIKAGKTNDFFFGL